VCQAVERDIGKPYRDTLAGDLVPLADACKFLESNAAKVLKPRRPSRWSAPLIFWAQSDEVHRRPRGVVGIIGTWNLPFFLSGLQSLHALVAGNGVLFKPSELASRSGQVLTELLGRSGFPADLFQCLPSTREAGKDLADADIDHLIFTGHSSTGRAIARHLGERLISSTMELSGCDPLFLLDDGDPALAAKGAWFGATINNGQACIGTRRAFVPRPRLEEFLAVLQPRIREAQPMPTVLPVQMELAERVIADAVSRGARLLRREDAVLPPLHIQPAVLVDVPADAQFCQEAIFAPLLAVMPYDRLEDALAANACCPYRLSASIFTASHARAVELAGKLGCPVVSINDMIMPLGNPGTPFGGKGSSGWGVTMGVEGLLEMTVPQVISHVHGGMRPHYDWHGSHWLIQADTMEAWLDCWLAPSLKTRLGGAWRLMKRFFT
jgi:acyl-CoA reductase-like NAD-dependent aldehyde dehydrogenase